jgi:hypothetical protein
MSRGSRPQRQWLTEKTRPIRERRLIGLLQNRAAELGVQYGLGEPSCSKPGSQELPWKHMSSSGIAKATSWAILA